MNTYSVKRSLFVALCIVSSIGLSGCAENDYSYPHRGYGGGYGGGGYGGGYNNGYGSYPNHHYENRCSSGNSYPSHSNRCSSSHSDRCGRSHGEYIPPPRPRDNDYHNPPPPPRPADPVVRPSCPPDTTFDGHSCRITDPHKIKPGHKGTVNACPKGMWLSGDQCVKNNH